MTESNIEIRLRALELDHAGQTVILHTIKEKVDEIGNSLKCEIKERREQDEKQKEEGFKMKLKIYGIAAFLGLSGGGAFHFISRLFG